jgi:hypothetical protein
MKRFIVRTLMFIIVVLMIDTAYGKICEFMRSHVRGGFTYIDKYVCDSARQDILIFGSSRARMQYDPQILSDSLRMSCFNCGSNGMGIIFHYGRLKIISRRYMPKVIIYDILPVLDEMTRDDNIIFANPLRPYYSVKGVDSIFWKIDKTERMKMLSQMYKYHAEFIPYLLDYRNTVHAPLGYEPGTGIVSNNLKIEEKTDYTVDSLKLYYLEKFIQECKGKTYLIFAAAPRWKYPESGNAFDPLIKLCRKYDIPFLNHYNDKRFIYKQDYYSDGTHFNKTGATAYSKMLSAELAKLMKNNKKKNGCKI